MGNFNQYFRNTGAKIMVDRFFSNIDEYNPDNKVTSMDFKVLSDNTYPASYYIENNLTATHKVVIEYTINEEDEIRTTEFEVPMEIDGAFIIEGAYRISTNRLGSDYDCRIKMSGTGDYKVNFDFDRYYDITKGVLKIKKVNPDLGIPDKPMQFDLDEIDEVLQNPELKEVLKLTERQTKKLMIKLDLDYKPEYITKQLIQDCLAFGDDRLHDFIIDKTIESVSSSFMQFLFKENNGRNFYGTRRRIRDYFTKYGRLQDQINSLTTLCIRFWKGSADAKSSDIQVPPGVNSINLESIGNKIIVPKSVAFNKTFGDLIDIAD